MLYLLDRLISNLSHDIGVDLGTANTLVLVKNKGIIIREPTVVAMHKKTKQISTKINGDYLTISVKKQNEIQAP